MGGSVGGGLGPQDIQRLREEARRRLEQSTNETAINAYLQQVLSQINDRDIAIVNQRLDELQDALGTEIDIDRLLFGGSVAKHTYVNGLSDIDALVILDSSDMSDDSPQELLSSFESLLNRRLSGRSVSSIHAGNMAVTVEFRDGTEIQLLPAYKARGRLRIPSSDGTSWSQIDPQQFSGRLTEINQRHGGGVVPAVKLAKSLLHSTLNNDAPSGYHVEALAVSAFRSYTGRHTPSAMLAHFLDSASRHVLHRLRDVTGQSGFVDDYLGEPNSSGRQSLSRAFQRISQKLGRLRLADWHEMFE